MPKLPTWDDVKKLADELEAKAQSAGAAAKEKWNEQVRPKLAELQQKVEATGQRAGEAVQTQLGVLNEALGRFQQMLAEDLKIGRKTPPDDKV